MLDAMLLLSRTQILAQVTDEASLDGRTTGLLAFNGALLGGTLAARSLLGPCWWTPLVVVALASSPCLWSVFQKSSAFGPPAREFFEEFGGQDAIRARTQLLADLDDAFAFNAARVRTKTLRLQWALGTLAAGLFVAAVLIAAVRPTTMSACPSGQTRAPVRSHRHRYQCLGRPVSRLSGQAELSGTAQNEAKGLSR